MRKVMRINNHVKPKTWNLVSKPRFYSGLVPRGEFGTYSVIEGILFPSLDWIFWLERRMSFLYSFVAKIKCSHTLKI